jgi:hypothetical protein
MGDKYNGYQRFLDNIGLFANDEIGLSLSDYYHSNFIIPFDLSPQADNGFLMHTPNKGSLNFNCTFASDTTEPLTAICYAVFDNSIEVDSKQEVQLDYSIENMYIIKNVYYS